MKKVYLIRILFWLFLLMVETIVAQDPFHIIYNVNDGLPSDEVYDLSIDKRGMLWLTTDRGVCIYNGYEFETLGTADGLESNTNFEIIEAPNDELWFCSSNGKISIYKNGKFHNYVHNDALIEATDGKHLIDLAFKDDKVYFVARILYKFYFELNTVTGELKTISANSILGNTELSIFPYLQSNGFAKEKKEVGDKIICISRQQTYLCEKEKVQPILPDLISDCLFKDSKGNIWIGAENGLYLFEQGNFNRAPKHYFKNTFISSIVEDSDNNYWVSTLDKGIFFVPTFNINEVSFDPKITVTKKVVLFSPLKNNLLFQTANGKILNIDSRNLQKSELLSENKYAFSKHYFTDNGLRIGPKNFEIVDNKIKQTEIEDLYIINEHFSFSILATGGSLIEDRNKYTRFNEIDTPLNNRKITKLVHGEKDSILIGTRNGLLTLKVEPPFNVTDLGEKNPLLNSRISDILPSHKDGFWLPTIGNGLLHLDKDTTYRIASEHGLSSNMINAIDIQNDSTLWLATNKGINKIAFTSKDDFSNYEISTYFTNDGLLSNYINDVVYWNDKLFVAYNNGVNYFDPDNISRSTNVPNIILDSAQILINDHGIQHSEELAHNENDIVFHFTGVSFSKPIDLPFYRFALKKNKETEIEWFYTNERTARFTNLAAGNYEFIVDARNRSNTWSGSPGQISFSIKPHFSATIWFWGLCALLIFSIIGYYLLLKNRSVRQKQKLQEAQFRTQNAELSALRSQMNPHFIFNSLNSIQNYMFKHEIENANYYLSQFSALVRRSLEFSKLSYIPLTEEISFIKIYMELELMRFPDTFDFELIISEDIPQDIYFIPPLLIQPILENSIKHGFKHIQKRGLLSLEIIDLQNSHSLKIVVEDNGKGIAENRRPEQVEKDSKHKSFGINLIRDRITLLNKELKEKVASFKYFNKKSDSGLRTELILPLKYTRKK